MVFAESWLTRNPSVFKYVARVSGQLAFITLSLLGTANPVCQMVTKSAYQRLQSSIIDRLACLFFSL